MVPGALHDQHANALVRSHLLDQRNECIAHRPIKRVQRGWTIEREGGHTRNAGVRCKQDGGVRIHAKTSKAVRTVLK